MNHSPETETSKYAFLSATFSHHREVVKKREAIMGAAVVFDLYKLQTKIEAPGIISATSEGMKLSTVFISDENFFQRLTTDPKYRVAGFTAQEWKNLDLIALNLNWEASSLIADFVLQTSILLDIHPDEITEQIGREAQKVTRRFMAQRLHVLYRKKWYDWLGRKYT